MSQDTPPAPAPARLTPARRLGRRTPTCRKPASGAAPVGGGQQGQCHRLSRRRGSARRAHAAAAPAADNCCLEHRGCAPLRTCLSRGGAAAQPVCQVAHPRADEHLHARLVAGTHEHLSSKKGRQEWAHMASAGAAFASSIPFRSVLPLSRRLSGSAAVHAALQAGPGRHGVRPTAQPPVALTVLVAAMCVLVRLRGMPAACSQNMQPPNGRTECGS